MNPETLDFNPDDFDPQNQSKQDSNLFVKFFMKPVQDKAASLKEGRPIFKDTLYIDIRIPGEKDSAACHPVTGRDIKRFPAHYQAYMNRTSNEKLEGTPLSQWPQLTRAQVEELAFFNCKTVEQLASMSDSAAQKFMGMNTLRQKAKDWLAENEEKTRLAAQNETLQAELKARDDRLEALEAQLREMQSRPTIKPKPRGRPKKAVSNASATDSNSE